MTQINDPVRRPVIVEADEELDMTPYIVCLQNPDALPMFEIAICDSAAEAQDWAEALLPLAPGFEVARIFGPPCSHPDLP